MAKKSNEKPNTLSSFKDIVGFMFKCEFKTDMGRVNFGFGVLIAFIYLAYAVPALFCLIFSMFSKNNPDLLKYPSLIWLVVYMLVCALLLCVVEVFRMKINKSNE